MKKLVLVSFIVLASPLLVTVNDSQPASTSAMVAYAGKTVFGGYCDPCTSQPGTCSPDSQDSPCLNGATAPAPDTALSAGSITLIALTMLALIYGLRP